MASPSGLAESPIESVPYLPEHPLVVICPSRKWVALNLRDLWAYREVLYFLMWRDIKVRYKQTLFGVAWAVLQPLLTMLIFALFFGKLAGMPSDGIPYPLFAFSGLVPWTFFANGVAGGGNSLIGSPNLITKVYFPRMIIPGAAVGAGLLDFAIAFVLLVGMMAYYGIGLTWNLIAAPLFVVLITLLALAVGLWFAALNVRYRDIRYVLPFLIQLWMFTTPIIYPSSLVPVDWRWVLALNPLAGLVEGLRASLFGHAWDWVALTISTTVTLVSLVAFAYTFRSMEKSFADIV
jgi:homopolymeric O-antigen transport system permease protein